MRRRRMMETVSAGGGASVPVAPTTFDDVLFFDDFTNPLGASSIGNQYYAPFNSLGVFWTLAGSGMGSFSSGKMATAATGGYATLNSALPANYTIEADVTLGTTYWTGFVLRFSNATTYYSVVFRLESGANKVSLMDVSGGSYPVLAEAAVSIAAGGTYHLKVVVTGNSIEVFVDGTSKFTYASMTKRPTVFTSGCIHDSVGGDTGARFDNFLITTPVTYTKNKSFIRKTDTNTIALYLPIPTETDPLVQTCYVMKKIVTAIAGWGFASNCWCLDSAFIVKRNGTTTIPIYYASSLSGGESSWEWAYMIGADADIEASYDFYGNIAHQAEQSTAASFDVDGSAKTLANGDTWEGDVIVVNQTRNIIYPKDKTTDIGDVASTHTFTGLTGTLEVAHQHSYAAGYKIYLAYSAMLPTLYNYWELIKVGAGAEYTRVKNGSNQFKTESASGYARSASHSYKITLNLPDSGPNISGDWSHTSALDKFFFSDINSAKGKHYATWVSTVFASRITAASSSHRQQYIVSKV